MIACVRVRVRVCECVSVSVCIGVHAALLKQKVDEVGKQTEQRRREQERSFRLVSSPP